MKLITDTSKLAAAIRSIAKRGAKLDADIHTAGLSCMEHARLHNDARKLQDLIAALPAGVRKLAFIAWAEDFAPVTVDRETFAVKLKKGREDSDFNLPGADATPFHAYTREKDPKKALEIPRLISGLASKGKETDTSKVAPQAALMAARLAAYAEDLMRDDAFRAELDALTVFNASGE